MSVVNGCKLGEVSRAAAGNFVSASTVVQSFLTCSKLGEAYYCYVSAKKGFLRFLVMY